MDREKRVRIFCDFCADGIWDVGKAGLPISEELRRRLEEWNWWYDLAYDHDPDQRDMDIEEFSAIGLELARAVKAELPDWTVVYLDEAAQDRAFVMKDRFGVEPPRCAWEYVVTLGDSATPQSWPGQRIGIVGSRNYEADWNVRWFVRSLASGVTVVTGCAPGIDSVAQGEASARDLSTRMVPASANDAALVLDEPDRLVAFWDGRSHRVMTVILHARAEGIPVTIIDAAGNEVPIIQLLVMAEEQGVFAEWLDLRRRMDRPVDVDDIDEDYLRRLWCPSVGYQDVGQGEEWSEGPVTEAGWYVFTWDDPGRYRPDGPYRSCEEAITATRLSYFNVKYKLGGWRRWE